MTQDIIKKVFTPEVVDDSGTPLVGPAMDAALKQATELAQLAQLAHIRIALERQNFQGKHDPWKLNVNDQVQHLDTTNNEDNAPWISAFIVNRSKVAVRVQVNETTQRWMILGPFETRIIDRSHAEERINYINYQCDTGLTGTLEVEGTY
jgi:hypothetical protein